MMTSLFVFVIFLGRLETLFRWLIQQAGIFITTALPLPRT